jgi:hypothetical protein
VKLAQIQDFFLSDFVDGVLDSANFAFRKFHF